MSAFEPDMDNTNCSKDKHKLSTHELNTKELNPSLLNTVRISKSEETVPNTVTTSKSNSIKSEKDIRFSLASTHLNDSSDSSLERDVKSKSHRLSEGCKELIDRQDSRSSIHSPKVPRKYFTNWRTACDKTKDRTKELLKRWRTLPESEGHGEDEDTISHEDKESAKGHGWSVHVWTTWVNRFSIDGGDGVDIDGDDDDIPPRLSPLQADKMTLFFNELLDTDRDDLVSEQDFEHFCEKLAHFADWSNNSPEYHILLEVKNEFVENFIDPLPSQYKDKPYWKRLSADLPPGTVDCENWLARWRILLPSCGRFHRFPLFLQYFCKILFGVVNKSGSGNISEDEMRAFYMSVVGLSTSRCDLIMDTAFKLLTSNRHLQLDFDTYKRCYSNWLCGKNPNGPGQWILVPPRGPLSKELFPVDYSALNTDPAHLERYTPNNKTNRHSVIV